MLILSVLIQSASMPIQQAQTQISFEVSEAGRVENCVVKKASGLPQLDSKACAIAADKARYVPAHDARGKPIRVNKTMKISWRIIDSPKSTASADPS